MCAVFRCFMLHAFFSSPTWVLTSTSVSNVSCVADVDGSGSSSDKRRHFAAGTGRFESGNELLCFRLNRMCLILCANEVVNIDYIHNAKQHRCCDKVTLLHVSKNIQFNHKNEITRVSLTTFGIIARHIIF